MNSPLHKLKSNSKTRTTSFRKAFVAAGLLSGTALSSIVFAAPASAGACAAMNTLGALFAEPGSSCTQGNWIFKLNSYSSFNDADSIQIALGGTSLTYTIGTENGWGSSGNPYKINYTVTGDPIALAGRSLLQYSAAISSSLIPTPNNFGTYAVTSANAPGTATAVLTGIISTNDTVPYLTPGFLTDTFDAELLVTGGGIQSVQSTLNTKLADSTVPGPLPLLGAGAAFGFSRRIRSRIKASA